MPLKGKKVLIVSNDAGGAQVLSSWIKSNPDSDFSYILQGPARTIFAEKIKNLKLVDPLVTEVGKYDVVMTSTSWSTNLEKEWIEKAKNAKVFSISYLDHWSDYEKRFSLNGKKVLPSEVWVGDPEGFNIAHRLFQGPVIRLQPNLYLREIVELIIEKKQRSGEDRVGTENVLYVTEPTSEVAKRELGDEGGFGYTEIQALEEFLEYIQIKKIRIKNIRIRPHPSEDEAKYKAIADRYSSHFTLSVEKSHTIVEDCVWADWIVGCDSMVMAIGAMAGKRVSCFLPHGARRKPSLPFPAIEMMRGLKPRRAA